MHCLRALAPSNACTNCQVLEADIRDLKSQLQNAKPSIDAARKEAADARRETEGIMGENDNRCG